MSGATSLSVLVVADDPQLAGELEVALESATTARTRVRLAEGYEEGARAFRTQGPDLVCIALQGKVVDFAGFVRDVRALDPDALLVGVRDPRFDEREESPLLVEAPCRAITPD